MLPVEPRSIFVILPAYNEGPVIRDVAEELCAAGYSVVVIDDGSGTSPRLHLKGLPVFFLRHRINLGQGAALQTGIDFSLREGAQYLVTFDADGQHRAGDIPRLLQPLYEGKADMVLGSRFLPESWHNMRASRRLVLQAARYLNFLFTGLLLTDAHNGLRAMNREAAQKIELRENRMAHATEWLSLIRKKGIRYAELPVHVTYTAYSRKKGQGLWDSFRVFFDLLLAKLFG